MFYVFQDFFFHLRLNLSSKTIEQRHDKTNKMTLRPAKTQISLGIRPVWSEPSLCAQWVAKGPSFLHADSKDSDQTGRMPRMIWVFAGRTVILLVLSWCGSFFEVTMLKTGLTETIILCNESSAVIPTNVSGILNPYKPSGLAHPYQLDVSVSNFRGVWCTFSFLILFQTEIPVSEQWRPWSDAAFCGVWSGSTLFVWLQKKERQDNVG